MKVAFFDAKSYDHLYFDEELQKAGISAKFFETKLSADYAYLADGFDAVCVFVNDEVDKNCINALCKAGVKLIALRCAGYNNVDFKEAFGKIHVVRVPAYSPRAVAEHAAALLLSLNRRIHRAYSRIREGNFTLSGLIGMDLFEKNVGVVGTGRIGQCFIDICRGFGMKVLAYDPYPNENLGLDYVPLEEIWKRSDIISLHCPLTKETEKVINAHSIEIMKNGAIIINTSRGGLIDTEELIEGLQRGKIGGAGLDVYEEEADYFYEDRSDTIITDDNLVRLLAYPNVLVTSHQAFLTHEALGEIAKVTVENLLAYEKEEELENEICYRCDLKGACPKEKGQKRCF